MFPWEETALCSEKVAFADFNKRADLSVEQTVRVETMPDKPGKFGFGCPMGIFTDRLVVE